MEVKSVGTFPVKLVKLVTPPLPPQTKLNFEQNGWKWVLFLAQHYWVRGGGEQGDNMKNPKPIKKMSWRAESYITITWNCFFTQSQVLLSSIVAPHLCTRIWVGEMIGMLKKAIVELPVRMKGNWKCISENSLNPLGAQNRDLPPALQTLLTEVKLHLWRRL